MRRLFGTTGAGGASGAGAQATSVVWDPASVSWNDIQALIDATTGPLEIQLLIGAPYLIPGGLGTIDMHRAYFSQRTPIAIDTYVDLGDGTVLHDIGANFGSLILRTHSTTGAALTLTAPTPGSPYVIVSFFGAALFNAGTADHVIDVPDNGFIIIAQSQGAIYTGPASNLFRLGDNSIAIMLCEEMDGQQPWNTDQFVSVHATSLIAIVHDGSIGDYAGFPPFGAYAGAGPIQSTNTQSGLNGPTAFRPQGLFTAVQDGTIYKNTDLAILETWDVATSSWIPV